MENWYLCPPPEEYPAANPKIYAAGDVAEAEPALSGWTMAVDEILN
jgi:hypothetical protein